MTTRRDRGEPATSPKIVQTLLDQHVPQLAALPPIGLANTGSDNVLFRLGPNFVVRLPCVSNDAQRLAVALRWLTRLASGSPVAIPEVAHAGTPSDEFPHQRAVSRWLNGVDA